jgi:hypothetical protein
MGKIFVKKRRGREKTMTREHGDGLLTKQLVIFLLNGMIFMGFALIGYGVVSYFRADPWKTLDAIADFLSRVLTLIGTVLVSLSAYYSSNGRRADKHSRYIVAPFVILLVIATAGWWIADRGTLPAHIFNGFSALAIAGSILRALPFSEWEGYENDNTDNPK